MLAIQEEHQEESKSLLCLHHEKVKVINILGSITF